MCNSQWEQGKLDSHGGKPIIGLGALWTLFAWMHLSEYENYTLENPGNTVHKIREIWLRIWEIGEQGKLDSLGGKPIIGLGAPWTLGGSSRLHYSPPNISLKWNAYSHIYIYIIYSAGVSCQGYMDMFISIFAFNILTTFNDKKRYIPILSICQP